MHRWSRGSAVLDVVIGAAVIVFIILPVFSVILEKYIVLNKVQMIRDAVDMTNLSVYNALDAGSLGRNSVDFHDPKVQSIFSEMLCANLKLNADLTPQPASLAEDRVAVESISIFLSGFPQECPDHVQLARPTVHSCILVPIRPGLYRQLILGLMGRNYLELRVHMDSEIPVNN